MADILDLPNRCLGTLAAGYSGYSPACLRRVFWGRKVSPILPYATPDSHADSDLLFKANQAKSSISGVQEKFSVRQVKNKLQLTEAGAQGTHILKPIPSVGKNVDQMPANEHLTMQLAEQVFGIETAPNALIFFRDQTPAYITRRFDVLPSGEKIAQEDFASLAQKTPQTHGTHFKYSGNYFELFELLKKFVPAYSVESHKLYKIILFNYLFSNGDAHLKNFSISETGQGDFMLSPAYDLLNSRIHVDDEVFALKEGLLPPKLATGKIRAQFFRLAELAKLNNSRVVKIMDQMTASEDRVSALIKASFLSDRIKRNYLQAYQGRLKKLRSI